MKKILILSVLAFNLFSCKEKEELKPIIKEDKVILVDQVSDVKSEDETDKTEVKKIDTKKETSTDKKTVKPSEQKKKDTSNKVVNTHKPVSATAVTKTSKKRILSSSGQAIFVDGSSNANNLTADQYFILKNQAEKDAKIREKNLTKAKERGVVLRNLKVELEDLKKNKADQLIIDSKTQEYNKINIQVLQIAVAIKLLDDSNTSQKSLTRLIIMYGITE
ncbi:hypothetical protein EI427_01585 [Flammeovirga pectinis]|uniref:Uncharacterized protein n=1 Tax=Flammeovirga pectinis TaxID=2494373 RepID=A0A3Q9FN47_9BACT|nr:hypothetical protein [Flammeovirga pectinis]AZQ60950.1 hypothetical protein EI427_01585 [Flammeovirga pectinis]